MKNLAALRWMSLILLLAGCASAPRRGYTPPSPPAPETPLSEIPSYPDLQKAYDVSAKVCVYPTLWIAKPLSDGLSNAGYAVLPARPAPNESQVVNPDFIVDPLSFNHTTERKQGDLWLFTRIAVQVRRPLRVVSGETQVGESAQPRVFQVYARRNLGAVSAAVEANYRDNVGEAVGNLLRVDAFREALSRAAADGK